MKALKLTNCGNYFLDHNKWTKKERKRYGNANDDLFSMLDILKAVKRGNGYMPHSELSSLEGLVADYEVGMSYLRENQFVEDFKVKDAEKDGQEIRKQYKDYPLKRLYRVAFELNYQCQLSCQHCFQGSMPRNKGLGTDKIKELLENFSLLGIEEVMFYGGEATLRKDLFEILEYTAEKNFKIKVLTTNGFWENPRETAKKLKEAGLDHITFSLYGYKDQADAFSRKEGSYEKLQASIRSIKKEGINYCVVGQGDRNTPKRKRYINRLLWFNGVSPSQFSSLNKREKFLQKHELLYDDKYLIGNALNMPSDDEEIDLEDYIDEVKKGCSVFHHPYFLVVRPTGQVSSCFFTISGNEFGNVKDESLFSILNNIQNTTIYKHHSEKTLDSLLPLMDKKLFHFSGFPIECYASFVLNSIVTIKEQLIEEGWEEEKAIKEANLRTAKNLGFLKR